VKIETNLLLLVLLAFAVIGVVQWLKAVVAAVKAKDGIWQPFAVLVLSMVVAVVAGGGWNQIGVNALVVLALVELAWKLIVKTALNAVSKIGGGESVTSGQLQSVVEKLGQYLPATGESASDTGAGQAPEKAQE